MDTLKGSVTTTAYRASASTCIQEAAEIMAATRASALIVVDRASGHVIGIVTERDLVRRVLAATPTDDKALQGGDAPQNMSKLEVHTVMTANPRCVPEGTSCLQAMQIMCAGGFRHLPVVHDDKSPAGMMDSLLLAGSLVSDNSVRKRLPCLSARSHDSRFVIAQGTGGLDWVFKHMKKTLALFQPWTMTGAVGHGGGHVCTVPMDTAVAEAAFMMKSRGVSALLVTGKSGKLAGIFTERDAYVASSLGHGRSSATVLLIIAVVWWSQRR